MCDRDRHDAHVAADDHRAGALVQDDARGSIGRNLDVLDGGGGRDRLGLRRGTEVDGDGAGVERPGGRAAEGLVDGGGHPPGGREVGLMERQRQDALAPERDRHLALDERAAHEDRGRRVALLRRRPGGARREAAAERDRPLRHGVDLPVGSEERCGEERPALQALRVPERGDLGVDPVPLPRKGRQRRRYAHRCDVLDLQLARVHVEREAAPAEHVQHALHGEDRLLAVAGAVETGDQAVAGELVRADTFDRRDVLEPRGRCGGCRQDGEREPDCSAGRREGGAAAAPAPRIGGTVFQFKGRPAPRGARPADGVWGQRRSGAREAREHRTGPQYR